MIVMCELLNVTERAGMKRMKAVRGAVRRGLLAAAALAGMVILTLAAGSGTKPGNSIDLVLREAVEQNHRLALAINLVVELHAMNRCVSSFTFCVPRNS